MIRTRADGVPSRAGRLRGGLLTALPAFWVLAVMGWELVLPSSGAQFARLLAAAPAIACAGTGRRRCVVMGGVLAVFLVAAYLLKTHAQKKRIVLLASHLARYDIEKLMENLTEGYLRCLGEDDPAKTRDVLAQDQPRGAPQALEPAAARDG